MSSLKAPAAVPFDHGRRRPSVVQAVLAEVFHGRLRAGQRLVTQDLADRFGVSHTPVREALIELAGIGVIDLLPNRGAVVRRVTSRDVWEVCQVRRVLECEATREACGRIDPVVLHGFRSEIERLADAAAPPKRQVALARDLDSRLHDRVAQSAGNAFLAKEIARLKTLFRAYRDAAWEQEEARNDFGRVLVEASEHLAVIEGLIANDSARATEAMAAHIRSGEHYWGRVIEQLIPKVGSC